MTDEPVLSDFGGDIEAMASALTPNLGLPYPSSSDPVAAGATNIHDLAAAIDASAKLLGPATPWLSADTNLRPPAYDGELAIMSFYGGHWHSTATVFALARGHNGDGTGIHWYIMGGPVAMTFFSAGSFGIGAGATVIDPEMYIDVMAVAPTPKGVYGWLHASITSLNGNFLPYLYNHISGSPNTQWTNNAQNWAYATVKSPWGLFQTRVGLMYFAGVASTRGTTSLTLEIAKLVV